MIGFTVGAQTVFPGLADYAASKAADLGDPTASTAAPTRASVVGQGKKETTMHDPTRVTDGNEVSPDDQIIAARPGAYLASVAQRTGGWQQQSPVLAQGCPFHPTAAAKTAPAQTTPA